MVAILFLHSIVTHSPINSKLDSKDDL